MLTDEGDVVLDIFGGSNTTGFAAEALRRKWLTFEQNKEYLVSSVFRFLEGRSVETVRSILEQLQADDKSLVLDDIVCSLGSERKTKTSRDALEEMTSEVRQMVLLEERKVYRTQKTPSNVRETRQGSRDGEA